MAPSDIPLSARSTKAAAPGLSYRGLSRTYQLPPCLLTTDDLRRLFVELNERTREAIERQVSAAQPPSGQDAKEFRSKVVEASPLTMMALGSGGEQVILNAAEAIQSSVLPDVITGIVYDSANAFQMQFNSPPLDRFKLTLDFTEPPGFNAYNPWDQPTPNKSALEIIGKTDTWVAGVHEMIRGFIERRKRRRAWLHSVVTFNLANWLIGLPLCFWGIYRVDSRLASLAQKWPVTVRDAFYIYVFLLFFLLFRILIAMLRWLFPVVELKGTRSGAARFVVGTVLLGVLSAIVYDFIKALL